LEDATGREPPLLRISAGDSELTGGRSTSRATKFL
jgi:hypothetical protein